MAGHERPGTTAVTVGINHAVLWVSDPHASAAFYREILGLVPVAEGGGGVFMKAPPSPNDHDLGLFPARPGVAPPRSPGLYHLAWEVPTLGALVEVRQRLEARGALVGASDHNVTKSLYARDPDGIEFEVMWQVPADQVPEGSGAAVLPLDLDAELERYGADTIGGGRSTQPSGS